MTPSEYASTHGVPQLQIGNPSPRLLKVQNSIDVQSKGSPTLSLPYRASNASLSSLSASTSTPTGSRSSSPNPFGSASRTFASPSLEGTTGEGDRYFSPADKARDPVLLGI
ncbi:hypothetical protein K3495_g13596 [Podosphaera aphanis]|nr:hypothetical protein K3495_g13596 [Podosphaera aphanis]